MTAVFTRSAWQELYRARTVSAEEAARRVGSGDNVYLPIGQQPEAFIHALVARGRELDSVTVTCLPGGEFGWFEPDYMGRVTVNVLYANMFTRDALDRRIADYTPFMMYGAHKAIDEDRDEAHRIAVNVLSVTPPNEHGYVNLGHSVWDAKTCVRRASTNIAIVNEHLPRGYGDTWLHVSELDLFVEDHQPLPDITARAYPPPESWDRPIAANVGSLIRDGDTIQIGTGSATGNLVRLGAFDGRSDLGYFGELTVPGTIDLVKKGVITGKRLTTIPGKFVAGTAGNSAEDRAFINDNPAFEMRAIDYVHDPRNIAANDNYRAINNALMVDLTGQICASHIGPRVYSGTGGHFPFAMGAFMSHGGRYICVLPATASGGTVSRIVPQLTAGQVVTVPRDIADTVVTEFGVARLLNRSVRERAEALISVAHPDFRAELRAAAQRFFWP